MRGPLEWTMCPIGYRPPIGRFWPPRRQLCPPRGQCCAEPGAGRSAPSARTTSSWRSISSLPPAAAVPGEAAGDPRWARSTTMMPALVTSEPEHVQQADRLAQDEHAGQDAGHRDGQVADARGRGTDGPYDGLAGPEGEGRGQRSAIEDDEERTEVPVDRGPLVALQDGGQDDHRHGGHQQLPDLDVEGRALPAVGTHVDERGGPRHGAQQQQRGSDEHLRRRPVDGGRVEEQEEAGQAEDQAGHLGPRGQRAGDDGHDGHDPERQRIGQDRRAAGFHEGQGEVHDADAHGDGQQAIGDDDGHICPGRPLQPPRTLHERRQDGHGHQQAEHGVGEGRDGLQADLGHRPVAAPDDDEGRQEQPGATGRGPCPGGHVARRLSRSASGRRWRPRARRG